MLSDLSIAILLAIALSLLIAIIEIKQHSDADLLTCLSGFFLIYFLILGFGNSLTTLIASASLTDYLPIETGGIADGANSLVSPGGAESLTNTNSAEKSALILPGPRWLWYAFVGVFGFEVILKNMNLTLFGKGVLTINDWIQKARDVTVAGAIKSQTTKNVAHLNKLANTLRNELDAADLKTYAVNVMGAEYVQQLIDITSTTGGDEKLALSLAIANHDVDNAKAIINAH